MKSISSQIAPASLIFLIAINPSHANYTVTPYQDTATGNTEQRLMSNGFHFGSLISDSAGHLIFKPHPDQNDINGWGISWYIAPFLAGADSSGGVVAAVQAESNGIALASQSPQDDSHPAAVGWQANPRSNHARIHPPPAAICTADWRCLRLLG